MTESDECSAQITSGQATLSSTKKGGERGASERLRYEEEEVIKIMNCGCVGGGEAQDGDFRTFTISTSLSLPVSLSPFLSLS